jgi:acyl-coenzyme A synthetase/AMP-(fatty) acid ligase
MEHLAAPLGCPAVALQPGPSLPAGTITSTRAGMPRPDDPLVILATSGSTGAPRLVPRHQAQFLDVAHLVADHHALRPGARQLNASQPFHALGAAPLVKTLTNGACTVFAASTDPADVLAAIHAFQPTMANLAPSAYEALIAAAAGGPAIPPFKRLISSAAPFPPASARAVCALLGAPLHRDYGLSEAICLAFSAPGDIDRAPAGNGGGETPRYRPMIPGTVAIADEEGNHLPPGEEGEIVARGPHVFHGYIGGDGSEFFPGGWFRTGDLGVMAGDGSFVITGRLKHLINRGGVKISPAEIEAVLLAHPAIAAAAAIPVAHPSLGDDIAAVIVPRPGANLPAREIRRWLLDHLPASRVPRFISFRDALPITNTGKLDRRALIAETATSSDESAR